MKKKREGFVPPISRRQFNKLTLAAGASLMFGGSIFSGCNSSDSDTGYPKGTENHTLHFDLSRLDADGEHILHTDAVHYTLQKHTPETLAKTAFGSDGYNIPTHYAEDVSFTSNKAHAFHVTTTHPERGPGFIMAALHIPQAARDKAGKEAREKGLYADAQTRRSFRDAGDVCSQQDEITDDFLTGFDSAKALVFHHPEISSLDPDTAAKVEVHINNSSAVSNLASQICSLGPAYEHDDAYDDGWCVLVPLKDADGNPKLDANNNQIYDYQFNPDLNTYIRDAVHEVLKAVKNDQDLNGVMYTSHPVGSDENEPVEDDSDNSTGSTKRHNLRDGENLTATFTGYRHNVHYMAPSLTSVSPREFSIVLANWNFLWYGLYVEYLDAAGNPISVSESGSFVSSINSLAQTASDSGSNVSPGAGLAPTFSSFLENLESDTMKWEAVVQSPPTLFGVPLPTANKYYITLPDGAVSVRLSLCGPGAFGKVDYSAALLPGIALSILFNMCLPMYFLWSGSGLDENASLWDIIKRPSNMFSILMVGINAINTVMNFNDANGLGLLCSLESLLAKLTQCLIQVMVNGTVSGMKDWFVEKESEEQADEAIPFLGWAVRILTVVGTIADMNISVAEVCTLPVAIQNTVTFTNTVELTVNCDSGYFQFPDKATYYEVRFKITDSDYPTAAFIGYDLDAATRAGTQFTVNISNIPTSGLDTDKVEIWFYDDRNKGFLAAHGIADFSNSTSSSTANIPAEITIIQNPYPIDANTVYHQARKLAYSNGNYVWRKTGLTDPAPVSPDCSAGLCELGNISIWVPEGMIGYSWTTRNRYHIKNINAKEDDPTPGMKILNSSDSTILPPIFYDKEAPRGTVDGNHFYLEPKDTSTSNPIYELRKLNLDKTTGTYNAGGSWGRFRINLDRIAAHPQGYIVGISKVYSKMAVLQLPSVAYDDDNHSNNAIIKFGEGVGDRLIKTPLALTVSHTGAILILQGDTGVMAIRSFDVHGNPWNFFSGGTSSVLNLTQVDSDAVWLDISIDDTELIFLLSYTGSGASASDYHLDVYKNDGTHVVRNSGIAVHSMIVDKFRTLYTLNQEMISGSSIIEPSVSVWLPEG